jgi:hypothetical protein
MRRLKPTQSPSGPNFTVAGFADRLRRAPAFLLAILVLLTAALQRTTPIV